MKWISLAGQHPKVGQYVLVWSPKANILDENSFPHRNIEIAACFIACYNRGFITVDNITIEPWFSERPSDDNHGTIDNVTHWIPLPKGPNEMD